VGAPDSAPTPTPKGGQLGFLIFTLLILLGMIAVGVSFARM